MRVVTTDSRGAKKIKREWLPRGILSYFSGKWINYIEKVDKDINGQWNAVTIKMNEKVILIITMYRLSDRSR